jgi:hypothetical protein
VKTLSTVFVMAPLFPPCMILQIHLYFGSKGGAAEGSNQPIRGNDGGREEMINQTTRGSG